MTTGPTALQRVLVAIDPVACGVPAITAALAELDPDVHELVLLVIASELPAAAAEAWGSADASNDAPAFRHAQSKLAAHLDEATRAGFAASGWVAPPRRLQLTAEIGAAAPYCCAVAVAPSGAWRGLTGRDASRLLEAAGVPTHLRCGTVD